MLFTFDRENDSTQIKEKRWRK